MEMDYYLFFYISEKYLQFRKKQKHLLRKTLIHPVQVAGSTYCGIAFQTGIVYIHLKDNLEKNWKNSVCIGARNLTNLYISKLYGRFH